MRRERKILRFRRGARQERRWNLGDPPGAAKRRRRTAVGRAGRRGLGAVAVVFVLPVLVDAPMGIAKGSGCRVTGLVDGDTVALWCPGAGLDRGRLPGFDTPEFRARCPREGWQAFAATWRLRWALWSAGDVTLVKQGRDRYDRALVRMRTDGTDVAREMIESDLARAYSGGPRDGWCT